MTRKRKRIEYWVCALGLSTGISVGAGCWGMADEHCGNLAGDHTCAERGTGAYCDTCRIADDGCSDVRPSEACQYPAGVGGEQTTSSAGDVTADGPAGTNSEETTAPEPNDTGSTAEPQPECMSNEDCHNPTAPLCGTREECVACDDMSDPNGACAGLDASLPVCDAGACVQCTKDASGACGGTSPICDDVRNTCVACTEHEQCGPAACNLYTGACLPPDAVVHVGEGQEYESLAAAVDGLAEQPEGTIIVHFDIYYETVTVTESRVLAFLASDAYLPIWDEGDSAEPQLSVMGGSTVFLDGLNLSRNSNAPALSVTDEHSLAWIDRSRVSNTGGGFLVEDDASLMLRNTFVGGDASNGNGNTADLLTVVNASAEILYSTLVSTDNHSVLSCTSPVSIRIRNSILATEGSAPDLNNCDEAIVTYTALESGVGKEGIYMLEMPQFEQWFLAYRYGNFHLLDQGVSVFANIAQWQPGDPRVDIDGALRPLVVGSSDFAGADVP